MLAVAGFAAVGVLVVGFYGYVFWQLYREHKRVGSLEKRLRDHLVEMDAESEVEPDSPSAGKLSQVSKHMRHETLIQVGVAIGGLVGIFAEIGLLSQLADSLH
jgi:hypothetical protein